MEEVDEIEILRPELCLRNVDVYAQQQNSVEKFQHMNYVDVGHFWN